MADILGRYYTEQKISTLLVSGFQMESPDTILELGVGNGSLIQAVHKRWNNAQFVTTDIDSNSFCRLKKDIPNLSVTKVNGLSRNLSKKLNLSVNGVDVAVCNPPYQAIACKTKTHIDILRRANFLNSLSLGRLTTDIVFLAQNLNLLKNDGELGIILPDTLLSGESFMPFRKDLMNCTTIINIIQLPQKVFKKTEALTHILLLKKRPSSVLGSISLQLSDNDGNIVSDIPVDSRKLAERMDYNYHQLSSRLLPTRGPTLNELGAKIFRGMFSKKILSDKLGAENFFHLNSFKSISNNSKVVFNGKVIAKSAKSGDILLARVGKRSVGNIAYVESGEFEISDCIIIIRVPIPWRERVFQSLRSEQGHSWISASTHGVCSRFITQRALGEFRV